MKISDILIFNILCTIINKKKTLNLYKNVPLRPETNIKERTEFEYIYILYYKTEIL